MYACNHAFTLFFYAVTLSYCLNLVKSYLKKKNLSILSNIVRTYALVYNAYQSLTRGRVSLASEQSVIRPLVRDCHSYLTFVAF